MAQVSVSRRIRGELPATVRLVAVLIISAGLPLVPSSLAKSAKSARGVAFKIQIGGQALTQDTKIVPGETPDSNEDAGGLMASLAVLGKDRGRTPYGVCLDIEGNSVRVGPKVERIGIQTFGIATIRVMGQVEFRLRDSKTEPPVSWQPYATVGAGWNFHSVGSKIEWPVAPPPTGTPLNLNLDGSPALRLGAGFHAKATQAGLWLNLEGGWKWDAGGFKMRVQGLPDREGSYNLSGVYLLLGITLRSSP